MNNYREKILAALRGESKSPEFSLPYDHLRSIVAFLSLMAASIRSISFLSFLSESRIIFEALYQLSNPLRQPGETAESQMVHWQLPIYGVWFHPTILLIMVLILRDITFSKRISLLTSRGLSAFIDLVHVRYHKPRINR